VKNFIGLGLIFNSIFFTIIISCIVKISLYLEVKLWEKNNLEKRFGKNYLEYKENI
jgi:protein-S-isoprenylcysteine O-methyltransferase Ste14